MDTDPRRRERHCRPVLDHGDRRPVRFQVSDLTFGHVHASLGNSRFSDVRTWAGPDGRSLNIAARRREYSESYWFGNPGNYQRYVLSHNDAGIGQFDFSIQMLGGPS